jgi:transcriptional regulator with XRE-family HTH domain
MASRSRRTARNPKPTRVTKSCLEQHKRQIRRRLAQVRGSRSQRSFARELGVFQQNVNRYENGTTPHADFLITLALQEKVSLDWLLLGKGRPRRR